MKTINLKKYYYPICKKDTFVEVPDEVADAIVEESRAEDANDARQHYHCYSLDASPGMENHFPEQAVSPEDILMEKETEREQEAARALMMERLREALATLTPRQASCLHARFWEGKARTRRLIERGAILEGIFPLAPDLPGVEVKAFLIALSHLPEAAELAAKLPKSGDKP